MDFPFKGYIKGMIQQYDDYFRKNNNIELWIVGSGDSYDEVSKEINLKEESIKNSIKLFGSVPYSKLSDLSDSASIYVGMGTTLLDFAAKGIVGITASAYQYDTYSSGFFVDNDCLGGPIDDQYGKYWNRDDFKTHKIYELIDEFIHMDDKDKITLSKKYINHYNTYYYIENVICDFMNIDGNFNSEKLNSFERLWFWTYYKKIWFIKHY